jgi:hypothetical protein
MANVEQQVARMQKKAVSKKQQETQSAKILYFAWNPQSKALPNIFLRSNLFTARHNNQPRTYRQKESIAVYGSGSITYTGQELRQNDEDMYLVLVDLVKRRYGFMPESQWPAGDSFRVEFTPKELIAALGITKSATTYALLQTTMTRLQGASLTIESTAENAGVDTSSGVSLSMLPSFGWKKRGGSESYWADIPKTLFALFARSHFTALHWEQRCKLNGGLAKWLHSFYSTHREPFNLTLDTIMLLCGLSSERRNLKIKVKKALDELKEINFLVSGIVENGKIFVEKSNDAERVATRQEHKEP